MEQKQKQYRAKMDFTTARGKISVGSILTEGLPCNSGIYYTLKGDKWVGKGEVENNPLIFELIDIPSNEETEIAKTILSQTNINEWEDIGKTYQSDLINASREILKKYKRNGKIVKESDRDLESKIQQIKEIAEKADIAVEKIRSILRVCEGSQSETEGYSDGGITREEVERVATELHEIKGEYARGESGDWEKWNDNYKDQLRLQAKYVLENFTRKEQK